MPSQPDSCSKCGQRTVPRAPDDRPQVSCPECNAAFLGSPVPVAAAIVLNERREVLLAKRRRPPFAGCWCLPIGFARAGEAIDGAARRVLRENAGIEGDVVRLVAADSTQDDPHGDLLTVTFELRKSGGTEAPGDAIDEVRYFPIGRRPELAFRSNEQAMRTCAALHLENWAIQDSFLTLQADEDKALLSDQLVDLIEQRADEIARGWLEELKTGRTAASYDRIDEQMLLHRAETAVSQFGRWLKGRDAMDEIKQFYRDIGRERRGQGFSLHEVISALSLLKKHVWKFAATQGISERPIDVYRVLELSRRIAVFFDRAVYQTARGFEA